MCLECQNSRIPKLFLDPRNLVSQKYCDPRMVTPWCHPGVTMVGPKGKRERFPGRNRGEKGKGKGAKPEMEPGSHWTVPPRGARTDETKRFPGWGTWRSNPPTSDTFGKPKLDKTPSWTEAQVRPNPKSDRTPRKSRPRVGPNATGGPEAPKDPPWPSFRTRGPRRA